MPNFSGITKYLSCTAFVREYCSSQFVSKGMIADFNLHDMGGGNPHAHILLTMRPLDEKGAGRGLTSPMSI